MAKRVDYKCSHLKNANYMSQHICKLNPYTVCIFTYVFISQYVQFFFINLVIKFLNKNFYSSNEMLIV
jgi:hypothetical protein